jgi:pimeloyl-ACP methyl ester carboxylesterase
LYRRANGYDTPCIEVGAGKNLVCPHDTLCDFRVWSPVLGPLARRYRVIVPSSRYYFPGRRDGSGPGFAIAQHVADVIALLETMDGSVNLLGH